jgi:hypothetical protein
VAFYSRSRPRLFLRITIDIEIAVANGRIIRLITFGIGLAITFVIDTAIGMVDHNQAFAFLNNNGNGHK